jgi:lysophospholipase L1-like esterase
MLKNKKGLLGSFWLIVLSTVFVLCLLELLFQIFYPVTFKTFMVPSRETWDDGGERFNSLNFHPSSSLGYEAAPNSKLGTNSLGMFDKERVMEKAKDVYRIVCLGDSTTANSEYTAILERLLNENKNNRRFEVWNCGVPAYTTIQYCRALKEKWLRYNPDMVIIGFCLNDFDVTPLIVRESDRLVGYWPNREIRPHVNLFLLQHSAFYRFIFMRLSISKMSDNDKDILKLSRSYLKDARDLLAKRRIRFLIVIFGLVDKLENYPSWARNYKDIKAIVKDYNIESIDMVPIFEANGPENLRSLKNDELHFNRKGSQIIGETIYSYLTKL